jgi:3-isopropylmalate dehydrogenase
MNIVVLPGDDIGPEITKAALSVVDSANKVFSLGLRFETHEVGMPCHRRTGTTLPEAVVEAALAADAVILGPAGMTEYPPREQGRHQRPRHHPQTARPLRQPAPGAQPRRYARCAPGLDCLVVRENTEGFYSDRNMFLGSGEFMPTEDVALSVRKITAHASRRIAKVAFEYAKRRRKHLTAVGKRHVLQLSDGIFMREMEAAAAQSPEVTWREMDIDAMAADIYSRPERHDVILITNMFGDILSNAAVAMSGGLGLAAALNAGDDHAAANAGHGSAPDIAGKDIANPTGLILSCAMLLEWLGTRHKREPLLAAARAIEAAVDATLADAECRTRDLGGRGTTQSFAAAVCKAISDEKPRVGLSRVEKIPLRCEVAR